MFKKINPSHVKQKSMEQNKILKQIANPFEFLKLNTTNMN